MDWLVTDLHTKQEIYFQDGENLIMHTKQETYFQDGENLSIERYAHEAQARV